ncbi:hypothetical protein BDR26DRAFT_127388 [Obelidium mucronatum]|nr:hypothetical protein BDR26DRAFT_127388 [Obelidium mucronatum]
MQREIASFQLLAFPVDESLAHSESLYSAISSLSDSSCFGFEDTVVFDGVEAATKHCCARKCHYKDQLLFPRVGSKWPSVLQLVQRLTQQPYPSTLVSSLSPIPAQPDMQLISSPPEISKAALEKGISILQLNHSSLPFRYLMTPSRLQYVEEPIFSVIIHEAPSACDTTASLSRLLESEQLFHDFEPTLSTCLDYLCNADGHASDQMELVVKIPSSIIVRSPDIQLARFGWFHVYYI